MPVTLLYKGQDIARRNVPALLDGLRAKYPNVTETALHEIVKVELARETPRQPGIVQALFGEDIRTEDVTTIEAWDLLTPFFQRLLRNPAAEGRTIEDIIDPRGMSRTYVWRQENHWLQVVTDADAAIIRQSGAATWFRDAARGDYVVPRAWDLPVRQSFEFMDPAEAKRFERDQRRKKQWSGV